MAFPTVVARNTDQQTTNSTSFVIDVPGFASRASGDIAIICVSKDDDDVMTGTFPPTGWNLGDNQVQGTAMRSFWIWRRMTGDGSDTSTITVTADSEQWKSRGWLIRGAHSSTDPVSSTVGTTTGTGVNMPALNPATWDVEDTLWLVYVGVDGGGAISAFPSGYSNTGSNTGSGISQGYGELESAAASQDPGNFTKASGEEARGYTIAIRPAPAAAPTSNDEITLLDSGEQTSAHDATSNSQNVSLSGSGNRLLVAVVQMEGASDPPPTITAATLGGVNLTSVLDAPFQVSRQHWFAIEEDDLPSNGTQSLSVTISPGRQFSVAWVLLQGTNNPLAVTDSTTNNATSGTSLNDTVEVSDENAVVLSAIYTNTDGGHSVTVDGNASGEVAQVLHDQGGGVISLFYNFLTTQTGSLTAASSFVSTNRILTSSLVVESTLGPIEGSLSGTGPAVTGSGTGTAESVGGGGGLSDIEFISLDAGDGAPPPNPRNVTVPSGTNLMIVCVHGYFINSLTGTYDEVALDVIYNDQEGEGPSDFVQMFYMLNPPVGEHALFFQGPGSGPADAYRISCLFFSGECEFQSGSTFAGSVGETNRTTSVDKSLIVGIIQGDAGPYSPVSGATELYDDSNGSYCSYRVDATAGTYAIGAQSFSAPDMVAAVFNPLETGGGDEIEAEVTVNGPSATGSGSGALQHNASATVTGPSAVASGSGALQHNASVAATGPLVNATGSASVQTNVTANVSGPAVTSSGSATVQHSAAAAITGPEVTGAGTATTAHICTIVATGPSVSATGTGLYPTFASVEVTGPVVSADGSGAVETQTTVAVTGPSVTGTGSALLHITASVAATGPSVSASGSASVANLSTVAATGPSVSATGSASVEQTASVSAVGPSVSATGSASVEHQADVSAVGPSVSSDGAADLTTFVTADVSGPGVIGQGFGVFGDAVSGQVVVTGPRVDASGSAVIPNIAVVVVQGPSLIATSIIATISNNILFISTGPSNSIESIGTTTQIASGNVQGPGNSASGSGDVMVPASVATLGPIISAAGVGSVAVPDGTVDVVGPNTTVEGAGSLATLVSWAVLGPHIFGTGNGLLPVDTELLVVGPITTASGSGQVGEVNFPGNVAVTVAAANVVVAITEAGLTVSESASQLNISLSEAGLTVTINDQQ